MCVGCARLAPCVEGEWSCRFSTAVREAPHHMEVAVVAQSTSSHLCCGCVQLKAWHWCETHTVHHTLNMSQRTAVIA